MDASKMGDDHAGTSRRRIRHTRNGKGDAETIPPEFRKGVLEIPHNLGVLNSCWFGTPLDGVNMLKADSSANNRAQIKLGRERSSSRRSRCLRTSPQPMFSLQSCLRTQFVDSGYQGANPSSGSLFFPHLSEQGCCSEVPCHQLNNEFLSSSGGTPHSGLHVFAFGAGKGHPRDVKSEDAQNNSASSALLPMEMGISSEKVDGMQLEISRRNWEGDIVKGGKQVIDVKFDEANSSSQGRQKRSVLYKKRKASFQPASIPPDQANTGGPAQEISPLTVEALLFSLGVGVGAKYELESNRSEVQTLSKKLNEAEDLIHDLRQQLKLRERTMIVGDVNSSQGIYVEKCLNSQTDRGTAAMTIYASSDCITSTEDSPMISLKESDISVRNIGTLDSMGSVGQINDLEAEFEAELEILQFNLAKECSPRTQGLAEITNPELDSFMDIVHGGLSTSGLPGAHDMEDNEYSPPHTAAQPPNWAVSPRELDRRLRIVLQKRQEERILELEAELKDAETKLEQKDQQLQTLKRHAYCLTKTAISGDEAAINFEESDLPKGNLHSSNSYERREECGSTDDQEALHFFLKHVSATSPGNVLNYTESSVSSVDDLARITSETSRKTRATYHDGGHQALEESGLNFTGIIHNVRKREQPVLIDGLSETPANSQIEREVGKVPTDFTDHSQKRLPHVTSDASEASELQVDKVSDALKPTSQVLNIVQESNSHISLGSLDDHLSEEEFEAICSKALFDDSVEVSGDLNSEHQSCSFKCMVQSSEAEKSQGNKDLLVMEPEVFCCADNVSCTANVEDTNIEGKSTNWAFSQYLKAKKPLLALNYAGIGRSNLQDEHCSQKIGSYFAAPANTPIASPCVTKEQLLGTSKLQLGAFSKRNWTENTHEKVRHWEKSSVEDAQISRKSVTERPSGQEEGILLWNSQTEQVFPASFSCSDSDSFWDDSSASDSEGNLGAVLIKRIVEKTRRDSRIVRDVQTMLAALESHETLITSEEYIALPEVGEKTTYKCEQGIHGSEVTKASSAVLDERTSSLNSPVTGDHSASMCFLKEFDDFTLKNVARN